MTGDERMEYTPTTAATFRRRLAAHDAEVIAGRIPEACDDGADPTLDHEQHPWPCGDATALAGQRGGVDVEAIRDALGDQAQTCLTSECSFAQTLQHQAERIAALTSPPAASRPASGPAQAAGGEPGFIDRLDAMLVRVSEGHRVDLPTFIDELADILTAARRAVEPPSVSGEQVEAVVQRRWDGTVGVAKSTIREIVMGILADLDINVREVRDAD